MTEYYFENQGVELLNNLYRALEGTREATEQLAQYVAEVHERDRYGFLYKVAHCRDYYDLADVISKCFDGLSEEHQDMFFRV